MSKPIAGRTIKRSNKDLGRILALAYLTDLDELDSWADEWAEALTSFFPNSKTDLLVGMGKGLEELTNSPEDLTEALHTCNNGLLASSPVTIKQFDIVARRILQDVIKPLQAHF